jgi:hypothetical protein
LGDLKLSKRAQKDTIQVIYSPTESPREKELFPVRGIAGGNYILLPLLYSLTSADNIGCEKITNVFAG